MRLVGKILVGLVILVLLYAGIKSRGKKPVYAFVPNPANDKEIVVRGWSEGELNTIVAKFKKKYGGDANGAFSVRFEAKGDIVRIVFPKDIPADGFRFLVNYIQYPEDFDLKDRVIRVQGRVTLTPDFDVPDERLVGQKASFYIPINDRDFDLVYVRVGEHTFENSFAALKWKAVIDPRVPTGLDF